MWEPSEKAQSLRKGIHTDIMHILIWYIYFYVNYPINCLNTYGKSIAKMLSSVQKKGENTFFGNIHMCFKPCIQNTALYGFNGSFKNLGLQIRMCLGFQVGWEAGRAGMLCEKQEFGTVLWWCEGDLWSSGGEKRTHRAVHCVSRVDKARSLKELGWRTATWRRMKAVGRWSMCPVSLYHLCRIVSKSYANAFNESVVFGDVWRGDWAGFMKGWNC